jgi:DNA repair ATPase RecN
MYFRIYYACNRVSLFQLYQKTDYHFRNLGMQRAFFLILESLNGTYFNNGKDELQFYFQPIKELILLIEERLLGEMSRIMLA